MSAITEQEAATLEPGVARNQYSADEALVSIAISLKRIADQVDGVVARGELTTAIFNGITEGIWRAKANV